MHESIGN